MTPTLSAPNKLSHLCDSLSKYDEDSNLEDNVSGGQIPRWNWEWIHQSGGVEDRAPSCT